MQDLTSAMQTALAPRTSAASVSRLRDVLFEIYTANTYPDINGRFDPSTATARWARASVTWLGNLYDRRILSFSTVEQHISGQFNEVKLTIENNDRFLSTFLATNDVNGMRLIVRYINQDYSAALADSLVVFVGRLEAPQGNIDRNQGEIVAREELASLDIEIPRRRVQPQDSVGRSPNDPLFDGFVFNARPSSVKYVESTYQRKLFFLLKKKDTIKYNQWSSQTGAEDSIVPLISGRVQMAGLEVFWVDIGFYIVGIWVYAGHKVTAIHQFQLPDSNYIFYGPYSNESTRQAHVHLGDPGGTGTNATPDNIENTYPQNMALLSRTAYVGFYIGGPESETQPFANPQMDDVPTLVAIVLGEVDLPDGGGVFNQKGYSDSPVYNARYVLTSPDYFGLDSRLVYDGELPTIHAERTKPILDKTNGELAFMTAQDAALLSAGRLVRVASTGLLDQRYYRHLLDGTYPDPLYSNILSPFPVSVSTPDPSAGGDQTLANGVTLSGQSVVAPNAKYYQINVPLGSTTLQIVATGSGDAAVYARANYKPSGQVGGTVPSGNYDYYVYTASPETITVTNPAAGTWWIAVVGHTGTTNFSIIATVTGGSSGLVALQKTVVRKAWTFNASVTDAVTASDFFNNVVLASGRLYRVNDGAGRIRIRARAPADSSFLYASASPGATSVKIANVEPWRASLQGYVLINVGLVTSEYRKVTSATFDSTVANTISLAVNDVSLAVSGATLSGGSSSVEASGTVTVATLAAVGTVLTVTVWGIPISYTVGTEDHKETIAAQLADMINADPNLRQYVRAVWNGAFVVTIYATIGILSFSSGLVNAQSAQVASPLTAPTATTTTGGTLTAGDYFLGYTLVDGTGDETLLSPLKKITIAAGQKVSVSSLGALPSGASSANWYFSPAVGDDHVQFLLNNSGGSFTNDVVASHDADYPPGLNTTGCETIRIKEVFNQFNTIDSSLTATPSQSKINQVTGSFVDAANGFKRTTITINDLAHQLAIRQVNKQEVNLSGVDNYSQADRILQAALAEQRDGGQRWSWATDDAGLPLEIGDVVAINDYNVNTGTLATDNVLVNQPVLIEDWSMDEDCKVSFTGIVYSSSLLEGQIGRKPIVVATTLKYLTEPPPVAVNLALSNVENFFTGVAVDFDFGSFVSGQNAHVFVKGPSFASPAVEPSDSTYKLVDTVFPDANSHGHLEYRATSAGTYWFKVVTQSAYGKTAASGHPVASILIRPPAPTNLAVLKLANGDRVLTWTPAVPGAFQPETYIVRVKDSGTSALKRTATVSVVDGKVPAKWTYSFGAGDQSKVTISGDGTISAVTPVGVAGVNYTSQVFAGDGDYEFEVDDRLIVQMILFESGSLNLLAELNNGYIGGTAAFIQFINADGVGTTTWRRRLHPGTKISLRIRNGTIEYRYDDNFWAWAASPAF